MERCCRRALIQATVKSVKPTATTISNAVTAQCGTSAVRSTQTTSSVAGTRSKSRCAKTVPTRVAVVPGGAFGRCRRNVATRASSPSLPGTIAFASSPTPNDEKTWISRG